MAFNRKFLLFFSIGVLSSAYSYSGFADLLDWGKATLMRTRLIFYVSRFWNQKKYGPVFFHQIAGDAIKQGAQVSNDVNTPVSVVINASGVIEAIHDGKKTPLVLGSMPDTASHIEQLKNAFNDSTRSSVGIHTLNERWECNTSGLSDLIKQDANLIQYKYDTPDLGAPLLVDMIRAIRDLENRDNTNQKVSLVHCKAGRGRSATVVAAYIAHVIHTTGQSATVDQIHDYLQAHRRQVWMHPHQRAALEVFMQELKAAGTFEVLYAKYRIDAEKRDAALAS